MVKLKVSTKINVKNLNMTKLFIVIIIVLFLVTATLLIFNWMISAKEPEPTGIKVDTSSYKSRAMNITENEIKTPELTPAEEISKLTIQLITSILPLGFIFWMILWFTKIFNKDDD
jgi:hypothetical protein